MNPISSQSSGNTTGVAQSAVEHVHAQLQLLHQEIAKIVVGQRSMIERIVTAMLADGHVLLEGPPGLAKTTMVKALSDCLHADFARIQFTPDLLPADLVGTQIFRPEQGDFTVKKGPVFCNILLADEINRAPAKVQSALLEAMQERQVTLAEQTFALPELFLVLATQNPLEQEGTYPLPEAQMDRFMFKLHVDYPSREEEKTILKRMAAHLPPPLHGILHNEDILAARQVAKEVYLDTRVEEYIVNIVFSTRKNNPSELNRYIEVGASPRASIAMAKAARAWAVWMQRNFVTPQDVKTIAADVLRHRIVLSYEAEAQKITTDDVVRNILHTLPVP